MVLGGRYDFTTHSGNNFNNFRNFYCNDSKANEEIPKTMKTERFFKKTWFKGN